MVKNHQRWSGTLKKKTHFDPRVGWHSWVPGHFFTENAFIERYPRSIQNPLWSLQLHRVLELWLPEVSTLMENLRDGRPKIAISRDFWHFSNFDVFLKGVPRGIQKPKRDLPKSYGTRDMAAAIFNFIRKHEGGLTKNRNFLNFRFSDPLGAQNGPQRTANRYYLGLF